ncbi:hypothetical protein EJB05_55952 [Eragrostis curvula]|uniref:Uncharacterized protein n=1 Tax=Eragrostis curvula TaxID=38414 RepID=A0A5J9SID3_9POAL|nr:hypothetical protein EJB05_55952 [Eragrostis curvula]
MKGNQKKSPGRSGRPLLFRQSQNIGVTCKCHVLISRSDPDVLVGGCMKNFREASHRQEPTRYVINSISMGLYTLIKPSWAYMSCWMRSF